MVASMEAITHCKFLLPLYTVFIVVASLSFRTTHYGLFVCRYIRPQFFYNNPLLSFIQFVIGPYTDDLGNVLPYAVEGVGVPVDPLAFAGLLGEFFVLFLSMIRDP